MSPDYIPVAIALPVAVTLWCTLAVLVWTEHHER